MKTLKVEDVYIAGYDTFADVAEQVCRGFIEQVYNSKRLTRRLAIDRQRNLKPNSPSRRLSLKHLVGPAAGVHSISACNFDPLAM